MERRSHGEWAVSRLPSRAEAAHLLCVDAAALPQELARAARWYALAGEFPDTPTGYVYGAGDAAAFHVTTAQWRTLLCLSPFLQRFIARTRSAAAQQWRVLQRAVLALLLLPLAQAALLHARRARPNIAAHTADYVLPRLPLLCRPRPPVSPQAPPC